MDPIFQSCKCQLSRLTRKHILYVSIVEALFSVLEENRLVPPKTPERSDKPKMAESTTLERRAIRNNRGRTLVSDDQEETYEMDRTPHETEWEDSSSNCTKQVCWATQKQSRTTKTNLARNSKRRPCKPQSPDRKPSLHRESGRNCTRPKRVANVGKERVRNGPEGMKFVQSVSQSVGPQTDHQWHYLFTWHVTSCCWLLQH